MTENKDTKHHQKIEKYLIDLGFIYPNNEIYGRLQNLWDYGHLAAVIKENIKNLWISYFVHKKLNSTLIDCSIFGGRQVWEASGHLSNFNDTLVDCKQCKKRNKIDEIENNLCLHCGSRELTEPKQFNLMFQTENYYLRPETAQSIFVNFKNILNTTGLTLPFSVCQVGKSFRNEITIQNSIFRTREFEQMEAEWFIFPQQSTELFSAILEDLKHFLTQEVGLSLDRLKFEEITGNELAHYSLRNTDIFFQFEWGWSELCGFADRGDFDLLNHQNHSKTALHFFDNKTSEKIIPHVLEHSTGLNRLLLAVITNAYTHEIDGDKERTYLKIKDTLAPYYFAVLPINKTHIERSMHLVSLLKQAGISTFFEDKGSIGKRYRKQDLIGTPYCISICDKSMEGTIDNFELTIRDRDSTNQKTINLKQLIDDQFKIHWS